MLGFDPEEWAKRNLVDIINPTPRFSSNDSGIPVDEWKKRIPKVEITAGLEALLSFHKNIAVASAEICTGLAASFLASGSDGIYLYNFFCDPDDIVKPQIHPYVRNCKTILAASDKEKIYDYPLRFAVINQEDEYIPGTSRRPLPCSVLKEPKSFDIITGKIPDGKLVSLIIGYKKEMPVTTFNGVVCTDGKRVDLTLIPGIGVQPADYVDSETVCIRYIIDSTLLDDKLQKIGFSSDKESSVEWIEIDVI